MKCKTVVSLENWREADPNKPQSPFPSSQISLPDSTKVTVLINKKNHLIDERVQAVRRDAALERQISTTQREIEGTSSYWYEQFRVKNRKKHGTEPRTIGNSGNADSHHNFADSTTTNSANAVDSA